MFKNEPLTSFTSEENRRVLSGALERLDARIRSGALKAFPIVNGREFNKGSEYTRTDPADSELAVGTTCLAGLPQAEEALAILDKSRANWESTPFSQRAAVLQRCAALMRERKFDLAALIIREAGKPWKEADADVAEAIDFCEFYAQEMLRLGPPCLTMEVPGEETFYFYQPRGICAVISPWNFPLAIACGMTVAALVTGNTVVLKPARQTGLIAFEFSKILLEAGLPPEVFAYLPGQGSAVGSFLVESPLLDMICFTGSMEVGLDIIRKAANTCAKQRNVKKVVAEMGGKNAIIVDEDADLDEAVKGVLGSAFGFSGQKCSACSRCIIVGDAYEPFMKRLVEAAGELIVGQPRDPATFMGPVIDEQARDRILKTISEAEEGLTQAFRGHAPGQGSFVPPVIFRDVPQNHPLWQEEVFGPVLACRSAASFAQALQLANDCRYALTGGVFSRSPANLELARANFKVGNLYLNRGCTGALVGRHPFGGFRMSGIGSKAGGRDYLLQFMEPRTVTENTMRRGFTPAS